MNFKDLENPLVDILIPVYNEEKYLPYVIQSLKQQKFINRIIVLNDYSTDKSKEICLKYGLEVFDVPLKFYERETEIEENLNFGLKKVKSPYVMKLDGDIQVSKNYIEKLIKFLERKDKSRYYCVGGLNIHIGPLWLNIRYILFNKYATGGARIYRTDILKKIGGWYAGKLFVRRYRYGYKFRAHEDVETDLYARKSGYFVKFFPNLKVLHFKSYSYPILFETYSLIYECLVVSILTFNLRRFDQSIKMFIDHILRKKNRLEIFKKSIIQFLKGLFIRLINNEEIQLKLKKKLG